MQDTHSKKTRLKSKELAIEQDIVKNDILAQQKLLQDQRDHQQSLKDQFIRENNKLIAIKAKRKEKEVSFQKLLIGGAG